MPGLKSVLEAGNWRELTIALPSNQHEDFLSQRFVRYSQTRVEAFGDANEVHVLRTQKVQRNGKTIEEALPRLTFAHGTPDYDREVEQCAVAGSLLFVLGRWRGSTPEIYFPDETLGLYRLRFTSRTSLQRLVGGIEQLRAMTSGSIAGLPLRLSLQFAEVADSGGVKRTVPYWSLRFLPPPDLRGELTASTWSVFKAAAFAEDATLRALPPGAAAAVTADVVAAEAPDVDLDNPPPDRATVERNARRYDEIFGPEDADTVEANGRTVNVATGEVLVDRPLTDQLRDEYYAQLKDAVTHGIVADDNAKEWALPKRATQAQITELSKKLRLRVEAHVEYVELGTDLADHYADAIERCAAASLEFRDQHVAFPAPVAHVQAAIAELEQRLVNRQPEQLPIS
jgi:hypothetical protein